MLNVEISYHLLIVEVFNRLICTNSINETISLEVFSEYFELADYHSEIKSQYLNAHAVEGLEMLKNEGYSIYCLSDFYTTAQVLKKIMEFHKIKHLFDDVFVSADFNASKQNGNLYLKILEKFNLEPKQVFMIGDNLWSDQEKATAAGIQSLRIPNRKFSKTNFRSSIGADSKDYRRILKKLNRHCNQKSTPPNSDYILFYTVFIERLYHLAKTKNLKNILFLSREGLYLKKLFDYYQNKVALKQEHKIRSHYLKTSRQASMLVALKEIDDEEFQFLRKKYPNISLEAFLKNLDFSEESIVNIIKDVNLEVDSKTKIDRFLDSEIYNRLVDNILFRKTYEVKRREQKIAFADYLSSFKIDFFSEGMHLADIGWGGSMQERLFDYFEGKVHVHGYYLGIREVYTICEKTKRYGLNFSVFPYPTYSDHIFRGNIELNEQLLSAPHGSTVSYTGPDNKFAKEFHYEDEKRIYHEHILDIQDFMFDAFKNLLDALESICYDKDTVQKEMMDYALRIGIFASKKNIIGAMKISEGFYTNVGDFSQGLTIGTNMNKKMIFKELKKVVLTPDKMFRYVLRVKPYLYTKNLYFLVYFLPTYLFYAYMKWNLWFRKSILAKNAYLKYSYLK